MAVLAMQYDLLHVGPAALKQARNAHVKKYTPFPRLFLPCRTLAREVVNRL